MAVEEEMNEAVSSQTFLTFSTLYLLSSGPPNCNEEKIRKLAVVRLEDGMRRNGKRGGESWRKGVLCTCLCKFAAVLIIPLLRCKTVDRETSRHSTLRKKRSRERRRES